MVVLIFAKCLLSWLLILFMFCDGGSVSRVRLLAFPGTVIVSPLVERVFGSLFAVVLTCQVADQMSET